MRRQFFVIQEFNRLFMNFEFVLFGFMVVFSLFSIFAGISSRILLLMNLAFIVAIIINYFIYNYQTYLFVRKNLDSIDYYNDIFSDTSNGKHAHVIVLQKIINDWQNCHANSANDQMISKYLFEQAELKALQSQINPHFLFNTLEAMRGYSYRQGQDELADILESMSTLFRSTLSNTDELIPVSKEMELIHHYLRIQRFRFFNRLNVDTSEGYDEAKHYYIPNMILQPIVENSISHGLEEKLGEAIIKISFYVSDPIMEICVNDNGTGIPVERLKLIQTKLNDSGISFDEDEKEALSTNVGIGLLNVHQRIRHLFGPEFGISIASLENYGTEVYIKLPLRLTAK